MLCAILSSIRSVRVSMDQDGKVRDIPTRLPRQRCKYSCNVPGAAHSIIMTMIIMRHCQRDWASQLTCSVSLSDRVYGPDDVGLISHLIRLLTSNHIHWHYLRAWVTLQFDILVRSDRLELHRNVREPWGHSGYRKRDGDIGRLHQSLLVQAYDLR